MSNGKNSQKSPIAKVAEVMRLAGALAGFIIEFLVSLLNLEQLRYWNQHRSELKKKLREVFSITDEYGDIRKQWEEFYKNQFGWDIDFSLVLIPARPESGNWRLLFITKGMTMNRAYEQASKLFKCWRYTNDLDKAIPTNVRNANEHYAVWVRDGVDPDTEYFGKSTRQADPDMKIGITVLERIIFEIKYFLETGNHLDIKGITLCSGSRDSDGGVPDCYWDWHDDEFWVYWCNLDYSDSVRGVRSAVSL